MVFAIFLRARACVSTQPDREWITQIFVLCSCLFVAYDTFALSWNVDRMHLVEMFTFQRNQQTTAAYTQGHQMNISIHSLPAIWVHFRVTHEKNTSFSTFHSFTVTKIPYSRCILLSFSVIQISKNEIGFSTLRNVYDKCTSFILFALIIYDYNCVRKKNSEQAKINEIWSARLMLFFHVSAHLRLVL